MPEICWQPATAVDHFQCQPMIAAQANHADGCPGMAIDIGECL